jgi:hypothetical protein
MLFEQSASDAAEMLGRKPAILSMSSAGSPPSLGWVGAFMTLDDSTWAEDEGGSLISKEFWAVVEERDAELDF